MPFLNRPNDVFVSYAHDDNLDGWVTHLALELEAEIPRHLPRNPDNSRAEVTIWKDDLLVRTGPLDERLETAVEESSTVLIVTSPDYLLSTWCRREGRSFFDRNLAQRDYRYFVAEKNHTDRASWPPFLFPGGDTTRSPLLSTVFYQKKAPQVYEPLPIRTTEGYRNPQSATSLGGLGAAMADVLLSLKE